MAIFNQKYFLLFLLYTGLCCVYCAVMLVSRFVSCTNNLRTCTITGFQAVLCVLNFVEALIFGLFVSVMMWDQMGAIFDNTPYIDSLKKKHGAKRGRYQSLKEVFGEPFGWRWFVPTAIAQPMRVAFDWELSRDELVAPPKPKTAAPATATATAAAGTNGVHHRTAPASTATTNGGAERSALLSDASTAATATA